MRIAVLVFVTAVIASTMACSDSNVPPATPTSTSLPAGTAVVEASPSTVSMAPVTRVGPLLDKRVYRVFDTLPVPVGIGFLDPAGDSVEIWTPWAMPPRAFPHLRSSQDGDLITYAYSTPGETHSFLVVRETGETYALREDSWAMASSEDHVLLGMVVGGSSQMFLLDLATLTLSDIDLNGFPANQTHVVTSNVGTQVALMAGSEIFSLDLLSGRVSRIGSFAQPSFIEPCRVISGSGPGLLATMVIGPSPAAGTTGMAGWWCKTLISASFPLQVN